MFQQILIALMLLTVLSGTEVFARVLSNNDESLPVHDMEQENPTKTRNKRFLDDLLEAIIDYLFEYDYDENDYNSKESDGFQGICKNCAVIVNNVNHFNSPNPSPVGKPNVQPPAPNGDKTETLSATQNSEVTQNPNTPTTKSVIEETKPSTAATNQAVDETTTTSTTTTTTTTTIKPNADAEVAGIPAAPVPEAVEGAEM
ncbi:hypothetical protein DOY81_006903 [Sarcophaga bullata]|nr:hypothetical protein DOY81_006903 [Sarcophaga bullata]